MMKNKVYKFKSISDMVDLAREVQSHVYWGHSYEYQGDSCKYNTFWDLIDYVIGTGECYTGVSISPDNEIWFIKENF